MPRLAVLPAYIAFLFIVYVRVILLSILFFLLFYYFTADSTFTLSDISLDPVVHAPAPLSMPPQAPAPPSATPLTTPSQHSTPPAPTLLSTPPAQTSSSRLRYTSGTESDSSSSSYRPPTPSILFYYIQNLNTPMRMRVEMS